MEWIIKSIPDDQFFYIPLKAHVVPCCKHCCIAAHGQVLRAGLTLELEKAQVRRATVRARRAVSKEHFTWPHFAKRNIMLVLKTQNSRSNNPCPTLLPGRAWKQIEFTFWIALLVGPWMRNRWQAIPVAGRKKWRRPYDIRPRTDNTCHLWHVEMAFMILLEVCWPEAMIRWTKRCAPSLPLQVMGVTACHSEWSCQFKVTGFEQFQAQVANGCNVERTRWGCTWRILKGRIFFKRPALTAYKQHRIRIMHLRLDWNFLSETMHLFFEEIFSMRNRRFIFSASFPIPANYTPLPTPSRITNKFGQSQQNRQHHRIIHDCWVKSAPPPKKNKSCDVLWGWRQAVERDIVEANP